jgi:PAS domain S-box-containing protein
MRFRNGDARATLRTESERRYKEIVETANEGIWTLNEEWRIAFVNRRMTELTGFTADAMLGRYPWDFVFEEDVSAMKALMDGRRRGPAENVMDVRFCHREGHEVWTLMAARPLLDDGGRFLGAHNLFTDVTDRHRTEQAVAESQKLVSDVVERCPFGIYIVDARFRIANMNTGSQQGAFKEVRPLLGRDFAEVVHLLWPEPAAAEILGHFRNTLESGEPYHSKDFAVRRQDIDSVQRYEWEISRITMPDGQYGVICYYYDSTKLCEVEEALKAADRRKDEFLALLAHELLTPLAAILTAVKLLQTKGPPDPRLDEWRDTIVRQTLQLRRLVDDLLDVGRITSGKLQLNREISDLTAAVRQAIETCAPWIGERHHQLHTVFPRDAVWVEMDVGRMVQVVCNLLTNAAKYMPDGGRIELRVDQGRGQAAISVRDEGVGIAAENPDRIFQRFVQLESSGPARKAGWASAFPS